MRLTDLTTATSVNTNDLIHIVIPDDTSQSPEGSSYKVEIGDYASIFGGNQNNFVRDLLINVNDLPTGYTEQDICDYINNLPDSEKTILETDSKWNVLIIEISSSGGGS